MHNGTVGVELLRCVSTVISELFDEVFVSLAKLIFWAVGDGEGLGTEMFQKVF